MKNRQVKIYKTRVKLIRIAQTIIKERRGKGTGDTQEKAITKIRQ